MKGPVKKHDPWTQNEMCRWKIYINWVLNMTYKYCYEKHNIVLFNHWSSLRVEQPSLRCFIWYFLGDWLLCGLRLDCCIFGTRGGAVGIFLNQGDRIEWFWGTNVNLGKLWFLKVALSGAHGMVLSIKFKIKFVLFEYQRQVNKQKVCRRVFLPLSRIQPK